MNIKFAKRFLAKARVPFNSSEERKKSKRRRKKESVKIKELHIGARLFAHRTV